MPTPARRKIGIEPVAVDLVVAPTSLTLEDRQELNAFFRERRKLRDQSPAVRAIRKQLAGKNAQTQSPASSDNVVVSISSIRPNPYAAVISAPKYAAARKAAPAAKKAAAPKKKK
jgi:hypothetical protein